MTNITFRPAIRENVGLLILISGGTGSGKTYSAMRLAAGIATAKDPDGRFAVIDTENRRASHYADFFNFDVFDLDPPFRPGRYTEAVKAADDAGYPVIVIDSMSHEWNGEGGILDWQVEEFARLDNKEANRLRSWTGPKVAHKRMVNDMLRAKAHVILCLRAEEKIDVIKDGNKTKIVPKISLVGLDGWIPITDKMLPFEATASFMLTADAPGYPKPIKLQRQHRDLFPLDKPIDEEAGKRVAEWATGGKAPRAEELPLETRIANVVEFFNRKDVATPTILEYLEVMAVEDITEEQFNHLKALAHDVREGDLSPAEAFKK